LSRNR